MTGILSLFTQMSTTSCCFVLWLQHLGASLMYTSWHQHAWHALQHLSFEFILPSCSCCIELSVSYLKLSHVLLFCTCGSSINLSNCTFQLVLILPHKQPFWREKKKNSLATIGVFHMLLCSHNETLMNDFGQFSSLIFRYSSSLDLVSSNHLLSEDLLS